MPFTNHQQAAKSFDALHAFYREQVEIAVENHGSVYALAKHLDKAESTVRAVLRRDEFMPLRRLALEIADDEAST